MYIDIFIVVLLLWAVIGGWRNGIVKEAVVSLGWIVGLLVAALFYNTLGDYLTVDGSQTNMLTSIVAFFILWIITPIVLGFVADRLSSVLSYVHLGFLNRLGGAALALVKYVLLLSCVFNAMSLLGIMNEQRTKGSTLYAPTKSVCRFLFFNVVQKISEPVMGTGSDTIWVSFKPDVANGKTDTTSHSR